MLGLENILPLLKCPACGSAHLSYTEAEFSCPACHTDYPIHAGIPDFAVHVEPGSTIAKIQQQYEGDPLKYAYQMRHWTLPLLGSSAAEFISLVDRVAATGGWLLEVPIGGGDLSLAIYKKWEGCQVVGVDLSWSMLGQAKQQIAALQLANIILIRADVACLPFKDQVFDTLLSLNGLPIFPDEAAALRNMQAVAKKQAHIAGACAVAGVDGLAGWLVKTFQKNKDRPQLTPESMAALLKTRWPDMTIKLSGAILIFERSYSL